MPSIARLKTLLSPVLLSVIFSTGPSLAAAPVQVYRFGGWVLVAPASLAPDLLAPGPYALPVFDSGIELLAYWQDGSDRALALRFNASDPKKDNAVLKSYRRSSRLKGCGFGISVNLPSLKTARPKDAAVAEFPDDGGFVLAGSQRGLKRAGDVLVADMGNARVQITDDSPVVRVGEWNSAEFCRFELKPSAEEDDRY